jgi:calcineurin-like phosphoesterase family protein
MGEVFLAADLHFGHIGVIAYSRTNFKNTEEHDELLISNWNKTVSKNDKVFILGDITLSKKHIPKLGRLHGLKVLVGGNHDDYNYTEYAEYIHDYRGSVSYDTNIFTHIPVHPSELREHGGRWWANFHGHLHHRPSPTDGLYVGVSMEQLPDFAPIEYGDALSIALNTYLQRGNKGLPHGHVSKT